MKIYTRTGDQGMTSLIGGKRIQKNHVRIEAYGTVDELIAYIGVVRDMQKNPEITTDLIRIQDYLMIVAAILATDCDDCNLKIPKLSEEAIVWLEENIDTMEEKLKPLKEFILPGGHPAVSFAHVSRTVCRRAERCVLTLSASSTVPDIILHFLNRLSDYLFVLSRFLSIEYQSIEIHWNTRLYK
jgi:cob(I)alamin adenosyltransferase